MPLLLSLCLFLFFINVLHPSSLLLHFLCFELRYELIRMFNECLWILSNSDVFQLDIILL